MCALAFTSLLSFLSETSCNRLNSDRGTTAALLVSASKLLNNMNALSPLRSFWELHGTYDVIEMPKHFSKTESPTGDDTMLTVHCDRMGSETCMELQTQVESKSPRLHSEDPRSNPGDLRSGSGTYPPKNILQSQKLSILLSYFA